MFEKGAVTAVSQTEKLRGRNAVPGGADVATTHPYILKYWSQRNTLSPHEVTAGSHKKVWLICEKGHEWESKVDTFTMMHSGCPYCAGKRAIPGKTDLATVRPDLMREWDAEKNADLNPAAILPGSHSNAWWKCERGHSWQAMIFSRAKENASGCPYCAGKRVLAGFNDLATLRPKLASEWSSAMNGSLTPENVTPGSNKKVWWQCREGHTWQAFVYARAKPNGTGCPVCAGTVKRRRSTVMEVPKPKTKAQPRKMNERIAGVNA